MIGLQKKLKALELHDAGNPIGIVSRLSGITPIQCKSLMHDARRVENLRSLQRFLDHEAGGLPVLQELVSIGMSSTQISEEILRLTGIDLHETFISHCVLNEEAWFDVGRYKTLCEKNRIKRITQAYNTRREREQAEQEQLGLMRLQRSKIPDFSGENVELTDASRTQGESKIPKSSAADLMTKVGGSSSDYEIASSFRGA
jgi:hypothetical protein